MASEVFSGPRWEKPYTNNTPQNVRVVINYMTSLVTTRREGASSGLQSNVISSYILELSWAGVTVTASSETKPGKEKDFAGNYTGGGPITIGRNLAGFALATRSAFGIGFIDTDRTVAVASNNCVTSSAQNPVVAFPTEIILAPKDTFNAKCGQYNIVVIPENG